LHGRPFVLVRAPASRQRHRPTNSSLDGDALIYKQYFHIGFAADTPNGLVVPVIKDADKKGILQISQEMGELAKKARDGKLTPAEMQGACFTISSLGHIGGTLLHAPSSMRPKWRSSE
jgi:pyruvate dehydrogenase E2 component (dihydrolipoamide acetyltransferase)